MAEIDFAFTQDKRWQELPPEKREAMLDIAFEEQVASRPEFEEFDDIKRAGMRDAFGIDAEQSARTSQFREHPLEYIPTDTFLDKVKNTGVDALKGTIGVPEAVVGVVDIFAGGRVGKELEKIGFKPDEAKDIAGAWYSQDRQQAQQEFSNAIGVADKFRAALDNPSIVAGAVVESLPLMGAGGVVGRGLGVVGRAGKLTNITRGAIGEGVVAAGSSAEGVRQQTVSGLLNTKQSVLSATSGALTTAFSRLGGKLADKMGIGDIDTVLASVGKEAGKAVRKNIARRTVEGFISEGVLEELPQSVQEQIASNIALEKDPFEGVDDAIVLGSLSGGVMGGGINLIQFGQPKSKEPNSFVTAARAAKGYTEKIAAAIKSGNADNLVDTKSEDYDPVVAVDALLEIKNKSENLSPKEKRKLQDDAIKVFGDLKAQHAEENKVLAAFDERVENGEELTEEEITIYEETLDRSLQITGTMQELRPIISGIHASGPASDTTKENLKNATNAEQTRSAVAQNLVENGGSDLDSNINLDEIHNSPDFDQPTQEWIGSVNELQKATKSVLTHADKTAGDVHNDIISGDGDFKGIRTYISAITDFVQNGSIGKAKNELAAMVNFAKDHKTKTDVLQRAFDAAQTGEELSKADQQLLNFYEQRRGGIFDFTTRPGAAQNWINLLKKEDIALEKAIQLGNQTITTLPKPVQQVSPQEAPAPATKSAATVAASDDSSPQTSAATPESVESPTTDSGETAPNIPQYGKDELDQTFDLRVEDEDGKKSKIPFTVQEALDLVQELRDEITILQKIKRCMG